MTIILHKWPDGVWRSQVPPIIEVPGRTNRDGLTRHTFRINPATGEVWVKVERA